jgi:hypothetical protein
MKLVEMRVWVPEAINTPIENELLIKDIVQALDGQEPGTQTMSVGGDTLVIGAVDSDGQICLYECEIRRASANVVEENLPDGCVGTLQNSTSAPC